jgi:hypothetical protein
MALTQELNNLESFTRRFIDTHFSRLKKISRECNTVIREKKIGKAAPIHEHKIVYMLVGTAIDYRIRAYFNRNIHKAPVIARGIEYLRKLDGLERPLIYPDRISGPELAENGRYWISETVVTPNPWYWRRRKNIPKKLFSSYEKFVARIRPERQQPAMQDEERLCQYCALFAYLTFIGRGANQSDETIKRLVKFGSPDIGEMLSIVDPMALNDILFLSNQFYEQHRHLLESFKKATVGGTLAGSHDVFGADFDLIVDGCLIELKTTLAPTITTAHLRQLVGYWLLDYDDACHITSTAIILTRQGYIRKFDVNRDLIEPNSDMHALRSQFRRGLQQESKRRRQVLSKILKRV